MALPDPKTGVLLIPSPASRSSQGSGWTREGGTYPAQNPTLNLAQTGFVFSLATLIE
jgi:hypothetical protein